MNKIDEIIRRILSIGYDYYKGGISTERIEEIKNDLKRKLKQAILEKEYTATQSNPMTGTGVVNVSDIEKLFEGGKEMNQGFSGGKLPENLNSDIRKHCKRERICPDCKGEGYISISETERQECPKCNGTGIVMGEE